MDDQNNPNASQNANQPEAKPNPPTELPPLSGTWPGAFGIYKYSKRAVLLNFGTLAVIWIVAIILTGPIDSRYPHGGQLLGWLISSLAAVGYTRAYIGGARGQKVSLSDAFHDPVALWLKLFVLHLLIGLLLIVSLILLIVPFFFVLPRVVLATYYLVDKDLGIMEALQASWDNTKGRAGLIWGIIGAGLAMVLLMLTIIGIPFAIYFLIMYSAAFAVAYDFTNKSPAVAAEPTVTPVSVPPESPTAA
jgi:hypothetical protein